MLPWVMMPVVLVVLMLMLMLILLVWVQELKLWVLMLLMVLMLLVLGWILLVLVHTNYLLTLQGLEPTLLLMLDLVLQIVGLTHNMDLYNLICHILQTVV